MFLLDPHIPMAQTLGCHNEGNTIIAQASRCFKSHLILSLILSFMRMGAIGGGTLTFPDQGEGPHRATLGQPLKINLRPDQKLLSIPPNFKKE